jgi:hypothetical protein
MNAADALMTPKKLSLVLDPNPAKARLKELGGSRDDRWNDRLVSLVANALPRMRDMDANDASAAASSVIAGMMDVNSTDPIEGIIVAQLIAAHEASLALYSLGWTQQMPEHFEGRVRYLQLADKAARTMAMLSERLDQHRNRGQQQIVVKHVTVNADQAVVAEAVTTGRSAPASPPATAVLTSAEKPITMLDELDRALRHDPVGVGVGVQTK